jgi:hypothetical protein
MTAQNPSDCQRCSFQNTVALNGLIAVFRAMRVKLAVSMREKRLKPTLVR